MSNAYARSSPTGAQSSAYISLLVYETSAVATAGKLIALFEDMAPCNYSPKECILAIDDEESFLGFLKTALESLGYRVFTASNPEEALKFYEERRREINVVL